MSRRRLAPIIAALALLPGLSACGNKHTPMHEAETEGVYVDVDAMKYQVQVSRELNPSIPEDQTFLTGIGAETADVAADETWFAVFIRVENEEDTAQKAATTYVIEDTEGNEYRPIPIGTENPFRYVDSVPAKSVAPGPDSVAGQTSLNGMELLFKLKRETLDNRPLFLKIHSPSDFSEVSEIDLDV